MDLRKNFLYLIKWVKIDKKLSGSEIFKHACPVDLWSIKISNWLLINLMSGHIFDYFFMVLAVVITLSLYNFQLVNLNFKVTLLIQWGVWVTYSSLWDCC